jgi:hypothetical protein
MLKKILICERLTNGSLRILDSKRMKLHLDEEAGTVWVTYQRKPYEIKGTFLSPYIQVR